MKKAAIILSGSGFQDGSEIQEATFSMLCANQSGFAITCFSLNQNQHHCMDHQSSSETSETRNVLTESARISRGHVQTLSTFDAQNFDALIIPGGYGAALNLCDFAVSQEKTKVHPDVQQAISQMHLRKKPIGTICIAPVLVANVLGKKSPRITLGAESKTCDILREWGAEVFPCPSGSYVEDPENRIWSTPAYMYDNAPMTDVFQGIQDMIIAIAKHLQAQHFDLQSCVAVPKSVLAEKVYAPMLLGLRLARHQV